MNAFARVEAAEAVTTTHAVEFTGRGGEYFRIWIVNVALTLLTAGIYSAWAKVRTTRYFYGNTRVAGHAFEYHASAWRILFGRVIALSIFAAYTLSVIVFPISFGMWFLALGFVMPWLVRSAIRFSARNTSWRNVRFNFSATYFEAFIAYVVWSVAALAFPFLIPYTRRVHDYFYINHYRFDGKKFQTEFSAGRIYAIYLIGFVLLVAVMVVMIGIVAGFMVGQTRMPEVFGKLNLPIGPADYSTIFLVIAGIAFSFIAVFVTTMVTNVAISNTRLEGGFALRSNASPWRVGWIMVTNTLLILLTLGFYYPFAKVRLARYRMQKYALIASGDLDAFTSESLENQSAIGEEIAGFFDFSFGL